MKIGVFGIGNVLMGDDAVGPTVVTLLDALWEFPEGVDIQDVGTPSLDLAARLGGYDAAIFVDAVSATAPPGTIRIYSRDEMLRHPPGLRLSPHDPSLKETLLTIEFVGDGPREVVMVGIVPETIDGFGMSEIVEAAVPRAMETVLSELARLGVNLRLREKPLSIAPWWRAA